jgi:hypothetical protein
MDMFDTADKYSGYQVPLGWYFDTDNTEFYTGTELEWSVGEERMASFECGSPFLYGGDSDVNGMWDEILGYVDRVRAKPWMYA